MNNEFDPKEYQSVLRKANEMAKSFEYNQAKGKFIWDKETIEEFKVPDLEELICSQYFLNLKDIIRPRVMEDIYELWEERKKRPIYTVCFEEGIGSGKTEKASIILWLQWFELTLMGLSPQKVFHMPHTSKISFLCASRTEAQAKDVAFSTVWGKFMSEFNQDYFPPNPRYFSEIQIRRNNTCVYPGNSSALSMQGYHYFGGIMDECNSMELTERSKKAKGEMHLYDAAEELASAITARMTSRYFDKAGMLVCISSKKFDEDFLEKKEQEYEMLCEESCVYFKKGMLYKSFYLSDKLPFSRYNKNVKQRFKDMMGDGYFYIDGDTGKEVSEETANIYFMLISKLEEYKKVVLEQWDVSDLEYERLRIAKKAKERNEEV